MRKVPLLFHLLWYIDNEIKKNEEESTLQLVFFGRHLKTLAKKVPVLPLTEHHAMKTYWGSGGTAPPIL
jgi:hypothetical protein